jgi:hypothetical protein
MGAVFQASKDGAYYALKLITNREATALQRFEREAHAIAAVGSHRHIVSIHRYAFWQDIPYVVMDYVAGHSLAEILAQDGLAYSVKESFEIIAKMAQALALVHAKGILHRDIKPDNILIRHHDGEPLLADFGLAQIRHAQTLTKTQEVLGTPHYMAPEQVSPKTSQLGPGADIWALGVVLYELLTGERPFSGLTLAELSAAILVREPAWPSKLNRKMSGEFDAIVLKCLHKNPPARYSSAGELAADCQAVIDGDAISASHSGLFVRVRRQLMRRTGPLGLAILFLVLVFSAIVGAAWLLMAQQNNERELALQQFGKPFGQLKLDFAKAQRNFSDHFAAHLLSGLQIKGQDELKNHCLHVKKCLLDLASFEQQVRRKFGSIEASQIPGGIVGNKEFQRLQLQALIMKAVRSHGKIDKPRKPPIPRSLKILLSSYQALHLGKWSRAELGFNKLANSVKSSRRLGHLGLAVVKYRRDEIEAVIPHLDRLFNDPVLKKRSLLFSRHVREELSRRELFKLNPQWAKAQRAFLDMDRFYAKAGFTSELVWEDWNRQLQRSFNEAESDFKDDHKRRFFAYQKLLKLKPVFPHLKLPIGGPALHQALGYFYRDHDQTGKALYHFLKVQRLNKTFELPSGFHSDDITLLMAKTFVEKARNKESTLDGLFDVVFQASRAQTYYPIMHSEWLLELYESGVLDQYVQKYPDEPYPYFWRGLRKLPPYQEGAWKHRKTMLKAVIADLSYAIDHRELPNYFRAIAIRTRCLRLLESAPSSQQNKPEFRQRLLEDLSRISESWDPEPDQLYKCMILVLGPSVGIEYLQKYTGKQRYWLKQRLTRSAAKSLGQGRPMGGHLNPMFLENYGSKIASTFVPEAECYMHAGQFKQALRILRRLQKDAYLEEEIDRIVALGICLEKLKLFDEMQIYLNKYKKWRHAKFLSVKRRIKKILKNRKKGKM